MDIGTEPIADDELLYRRVPMIWHDQTHGLNAQAFGPRKDDDTGLSVSRARYKTPAEAAKGQPGRSYYLAVLRAGDLRQIGVEVEPRPLPEDPSHAELANINAGNRRAAETTERQHSLVNLCRDVLGPFGSSDG